MAGLSSGTNGLEVVVSSALVGGFGLVKLAVLACVVDFLCDWAPLS